MEPFINSEKAFIEALEIMPGGVNSPVRAFNGIYKHPLFIFKARASSLFDIDNNKYIDYCLSWGVCIHGHAHEKILEAANSAMSHGTSFGAPTLSETTLAKLIVSMVPSIEKLRLVSSGTEAVMSAVRLARGYTGRSLILKFDGCYHGHSDGMLISAGSGVSGLLNSNSKGVTGNIMKDTLSIPFNDIEALEKVFKKQGNKIAAIIVEPVPANMGLILPDPSFLSLLRQITIQYGALLIFDEVISGFRISGGGAQQFYNVIPDLTVLGKIIGGGFPIAAYGGPAYIMDLISPAGDVYQAGTLSGNPVATAAGIAALEILNKPRFYDEYFSNIRSFEKNLLSLQHKFPVTINFLNGMFSIFFADSIPKNYQEVKLTDISRFPEFYNNVLSAGVYLSPGYFETNFISTAHSIQDFERTIEVIINSLNKIF